MRKISGVAAGLFGLALVTLGGCGSEEATSDAPAPEWLFTLQATDTSTYDPTTGRLTMPVDSVLAFTDRPDRFTTLDDPQSFADLWNDDGDDSFTADPPNVVVTWWPSGGGYAETMEVASVSGDVRYDPATTTLSMGIAADGSAALDLPTSMDQLSLFVDGLSANCPTDTGGSATISGNGKSSPVCITTKQF